MNKGLLITLVAVGLLVLGSAAVLIVFNYPQVGVGGFSVLSLEQVELRSSNPYLSGKTWLLTVRQGGLAQRAEGTFTPQDVEAKTSGDLRTVEDLTVEVNYQDQQCVYPVQQAGQRTPIYKADVMTWYYVPITSPCTVEEAYSRGVPQGRLIQGVGKRLVTCYAPFWTEKNDVGIFGQTDLRSRMSVNIEAGSESASKDLDTEASTQGNIGGFGYVIWQGNLDTGKSCSYTTDMPYQPTYRSGRWIVTDKGAYNTYLNQWDSQITESTDIEFWVDTLNNRADAALVSRNFGSYENPTSFGSAILREDIKSALQYPVLSIYVKADTLGIFTPTPELRLTSADSDCFATGEEGFIEIQAENIGEDDGAWTFFGTCDAGFTISRSQEIGIAAGQKKRVILPLSGTTADSELNGRCTITAESPAGQTTISTDVCVQPQQNCEPGELQCGSSGGVSVIKECNAAGTGFTIKENCGVGKICEAGGMFGNPSCVDEGSTGGGGFWGSIGNWFGDLFDTIQSWIKRFQIVLSIMVGLVSAILVGSYYRKIAELASLPKNGKALYIVAIVMGLLIGIISYLFFWWILAAIAILLIVRFLL